MCRLKSGIVLKNRVIVPDNYDSHTRMLEELGIKDNTINAMKTFVRFELLPSNNNIFSNINDWELNIDQDIVPDWWDADTYRSRIVEAVRDWAAKHIHINKEGLVLTEGTHYVKNCSVNCYDNAVVCAYAKSTVMAHTYSMVSAHKDAHIIGYDNSSITANDDSTVHAYGNSIVHAYDKSSIISFDQSTVEAWEDSDVIAYNHSTVDANHEATVTVTDFATVKARYHSTVKAYDSATVTVTDFATVKAYDNTLVKGYGESSVEAYGFSTVFSWHKEYPQHNVTLFDNAIHKDNFNKKLYQAGGWNTVNV